MLKETIESLNLKPGQIAVDCTLGLGGHSIEILKGIGPKGSLFAFEKDERNLVPAKARLEEVAENFEIFHDSFASLKDRLRGKGCDQINAIIFDLGLSSPHVDQPERGFSFRKDGPLDMRFDASKVSRPRTFSILGPKKKSLKFSGNTEKKGDLENWLRQ